MAFIMIPSKKYFLAARYATSVVSDPECSGEKRWNPMIEQGGFFREVVFAENLKPQTDFTLIQGCRHRLLLVGIWFGLIW